MDLPISTTAKGDNFEAKVFDILQTMLLNNELPVNSSHSRIFRKKKYYSSQRKSDIIVDISVECTLPGETEPSLYLMVECKDYKHPIPVNDIEEFYSKTRQITGLNVKAILFTTNILQEGALNFAITNKIRVMRIKPEGEPILLSFRKEGNTTKNVSKDFINAVLALTSETKSMLSSSFLGISFNGVFESIQAIIQDAILN
ncbi:MAG: restriction endonuclease [Bacteroidetes bacterium]|nr:restriction endonuclease [Bacteroidota bacterium]